MAEIGLAPIRMRDVDFRIEADGYRASVNEVRFVPQYEWEWGDYEGSYTSTPFNTRRRWVAQLGFVQDFATPGALSLYLIEHAAQDKVVTFTAQGVVVAATVMILPAAFGGVMGQIPVSAAVLPLHGEPDLSPQVTP